MLKIYTLKKTLSKELPLLENFSTQKQIGKNLNPKSLQKFQEEFAQKEITFLSVLSSTNEIAGYLILKETQGSMLLKRIVIDEKYLGIGTEVMQELEIYVLENYKLREICLDVYADNKRAIGLYEKLGYDRYNVGMENHREVWFYRKYFKGIQCKNI